MADEVVKEKPVRRPRTGQKRVDRTVEMLGRPGLLALGGRIYDEWDTALQGIRGRKVFREMMDQDALISGILYAFEMLIRQVHWSIQPANGSAEAKRLAQFVEECLNDMEESFPNTLSEMMSCLGYGWSYHELVYKYRKGPSEDPTVNSRYTDGKVGWRSWAVRSQEALDRWEFAEDGTLLGMWQIPPPDYRIRFVPYQKSMLIRPSVRRQNPEGRSILRGAYRAYYFRKNIQTTEAIGIERDLVGYPVMYAPQDVVAGSNEESKAAGDEYLKMLTNIRRDEQEGSLLPMVFDEKTGNQMYKLELLTTGGQRQFNAQPLTAKILTPSGWKPMGDMKVGDRVVCPLGYESRVLGIFPRGKRPIYRITTSDGRITHADAEHLWAVTNSKWSRRKRVKDAHPLLPQFKVLRTEQIADRLPTVGSRFVLPSMSTPLLGKSGMLPIDPYVLGVLLGDGHIGGGNGPRFYSADNGVASEVEKYLPDGDELHAWVDPNSGSGEAVLYRISGTTGRKQAATKASLLALDLWETTYRDKFIPESYLWASATSRLSLLQGLMDTDGCVDNRGFVSFVTASKDLHDGVLHLIRSLGGSAGSHVRQATSYRRPKDGSIREIDSTHYRLKNIRMPNGMVPFRLQRKIDRLRPMAMTYHNAITSVEYAGEEEVRCILVSSPSHLYVTDDFMVTHNTNEIVMRYSTEIAMSLLADFMMLGHGTRGANALSQSKIDMFNTAMSALMDAFCAEANTRAIPKLMYLNAEDVSLAPTLEHGEIERIDLVALGTFLFNLTQAGAMLDLQPGTPAFDFLMQEAGLPTEAMDRSTPNRVTVRDWKPGTPKAVAPGTRTPRGKALLRPPTTQGPFRPEPGNPQLPPLMQQGPANQPQVNESRRPATKPGSK